MIRVLLTVFLLAGCAPSDELSNLPPIAVDDGPPRSVTALQWQSIDAWRDVEPGVFPNAQAGGPIFDRIRDVLAMRDEACTTCNVVFGFDGDIEPASIDARFEGPGGTVPADVEWRADLHTLTMRAMPGHTFEPGERYVAILDGRGVDRLPIEARATFHTGEPAAQLRAVRAALYAELPPRAQVDAVWRGAQLDDLLGTGQTAPGFERVGDDGFAVRHETTSLVLTGSFDAPRVLDGKGSDVGVVQRVGGAPVVTGSDDVPFVLIVPKNADLQNLPVVVVHHGFAASRATALVLADTAGKAGWAVLGIDAYQHGARAYSSSDRRNAFRGVDEGDGFAETQMLDVVSRVFGLGGVPAELKLCPEYALSAFTQFVADGLSTVRLVREGDVAALQNVEGLENLRFDPTRTVFVGNSMGAVVGAGVIAVEPHLAGAVLNVMPGSIIETLVESGEFRPMSERIFLPLLGVDQAFDAVDRRMLMDPTVDLFRWVMEPTDPLALARSRVVDNVLVQLAEQDEVAAPRPSQSVVDAAGIEQVTVYDGAMHGMLEVAEQDSEFEQPLIPPLRRRDAPKRLANPIDAVHDEITDFLLAIDTR